MPNRIFALRVTEADHDIFAGLVHNYPTYSYDKWLKFRAQEADKRRAQGLEVIEVDVTPDEFSRYCQSTGARGDISTLRMLATLKGHGKFK